ncbi:hypothetical protein RF11_12073 [Thelohanellus kitauei]|uniref:Uncharacterized protein n=1 Tax=Thelohanellus kitauei TaxID=669202 RepID=A0A0C2MNI7_THEKT|nr:hypothetical protein RF11_12073 [Thelohanellus kitauei]
MELKETAILGQATSTETMCVWYTYHMEVCCEIVRTITTVKIDEGKFGSLKYNRGGLWRVNGFLEDITRKVERVFWYRWISEEDIGGWNNQQHLTVNHSYNFVYPDTGANTQNVEFKWWQIKRTLPVTHTHSGRLHL